MHVNDEEITSICIFTHEALPLAVLLIGFKITIRNRVNI